MSLDAQTMTLVTLAQKYAGDTVRQINRTAMAIRTLPIITGEGKNVAWAPEADGQNAEEYSDASPDVTNAASDAQDSATLAWSLMRANFRVTGLARAAARTSGTPAGNLALWARNLTNSSAKLASLINSRIFGGSGAGTPKQITGLDVAIGDDANLYAGIDRSSGGNAYFRPYVVDPGVDTQLAIGQVREDIKEIYIQSGQYPDLAFCHPSVFNELGNLFDANRQYMQQVTNFNTARGSIKLDGGFSGLSVDGTVFVKDKDATAQEIFYVNTNYVSLVVLPQDGQDLGLGPDTMLQANDGYGDVPLMFAYSKLAKTGDSDTAMVKIYTELQVKRPNSCGVRKHVKLNF